MKIPKAVYTILIPEKLEQRFKLFHEKYQLDFNLKARTSFKNDGMGATKRLGK